jgi:hypothetical protein
MGTYDGSSLHIIEAFPPYEALIKKASAIHTYIHKNPNSYTNSPHLPLIDHKTASKLPKFDRINYKANCRREKQEGTPPVLCYLRTTNMKNGLYEI